MMKKVISGITPVSPDLDNPVVQDPEVLPGSPRGEEPELAGSDPGQRYLAEPEDICLELRSTIFRAHDMQRGAPDPDKDRDRGTEEDELHPGFPEEIAVHHHTAHRCIL